VPGVTALQVEAGLFFADADCVRDAIESAAVADGTRAVVLDCQTTPSVDVTAARMLNELTASLGKRGVRLVLAGEIGQVRDMLTAVSGYDGPPDYHRTIQEAVTATAASRPPSPPGRNDGPTRTG
jgi:anti-anti-sigma regulatory factor